VFEQPFDGGAVQFRLAHPVEVAAQQLVHFIKFRRRAAGCGAANGCGEKKTKKKISRVQDDKVKVLFILPADRASHARALSAISRPKLRAVELNFPRRFISPVARLGQSPAQRRHPENPSSVRHDLIPGPGRAGVEDFVSGSRPASANPRIGLPFA